jgi:hypothetical protein
LLLTRRWLVRLAVLLLAVTAFLSLGWWQWQRAGEGNARSFGYAFEWPLFAAFAVWWWGRMFSMELHPPAEPPPIGPPPDGPRPPMSVSDSGEQPDDELTAYNQYLAWLHEQDQRQNR